MSEMIKKSKSNRALKFLRVIVFLLLAGNILLGILNAIMIGFIDFPCFVEYNEGNDCLSKSPQTGIWEPVEETTRIEAFMTTYIAGWSGGGCDYRHSQTDDLNLSTSVGVIELSRQGDSLLVNGSALEKGGLYERSYLLDWHPWIIAKTSFINAGVVADCQSDPAIKRLVVVGSYRTQTSLLKGGLVTLVLVIGLVFIHKQIRRGQ